jgi:hypothetical protein
MAAAKNIDQSLNPSQVFIYIFIKAATHDNSLSCHLKRKNRPSGVPADMAAQLENFRAVALAPRAPGMADYGSCSLTVCQHRFRRDRLTFPES